MPWSLKDLSPTSARLCLRVRDFLTSELGPDLRGKTLLTACSGGPDSLALATCLSILAPHAGFCLAAAHLDHGLRPESPHEAGKAAEQCAKCGLDLQIGRTSVRLWSQRTGKGLEEGARILRYRFLEGIRRRMGADYICLGHSLNDLAEDVLMRLIRGTGWPALSGMPALDRKRRLVRPFLLVTRRELVSLLKELSLCPVQDPSNQDLRFLRNRVRSRILPLFLKENPDFLQAVAALWSIGRDDEIFFDGHVEPFVVLEKSGVLVPRACLSQPRSIRMRALKRAAERVGAARAEALRSLDRLFTERKTGAVIQFPGPAYALVRRDGVRFARGRLPEEE